MEKTSTGLHGDTGSGKTALIGDFIESLYSVDKNIKALLITGERWGTIKHLHTKGVLDVWEITERQNPFEALRLAVAGYLPVDFQDPNSKLLPPSSETLSRYALRAFEGGSTFSQYLKGSQVKGGLANRAANGEHVGTADGKDGYTVNFIDGTVKVGGNSRSHYNIVQNEMQALINASHRLPGHLIWTFHSVNTTISTDKVYVPGIIGPELTGKAATPHVQRWFDMLINVRKVKLDPKKLDTEHRLYLKEHYDKAMPGIPYKAVIRLPLSVQALLDKDIPEYLPSVPGVMALAINLAYELQAKADEIMSKKGALTIER